MNSGADPISQVKALRAERDRLSEQIKQLDPEAVAEGQRRGMGVAELSIAIGASVSHVYNIQRQLREKESDQ